QPGLGGHLEAVADADHGAAGGRVLGHRVHDRREAGDGPGAEVVAVGEASRHHHRVDALHRTGPVPEQLGLAAELLAHPRDVELAVRAREHDDTHSGTHACSSSTVYRSITGLARSCLHIASTWSRAADSDGASSASRMVFAIDTSLTLS